MTRIPSNIYSHSQSAVPLPITQATLQLAERFARQQPTSQKAEQIRLNTIAVSIVNDYLHLMGLSTDLAIGDSWNPVMRLCADVADLAVVGAGKLECRSILTDPIQAEPTCPVPPETWDDRVGYVVVAIDEAAGEAKLLGFAEQAEEELSLNALQSPEALLDHLELLRSADQSAQSADQRADQRAVAIANLSRWLQNQVEAGWQTVESLLSPAQPAYGFRSVEAIPSENPIRRAKLIDLAIRLPDPVVLVVELEPTTHQTQIRLQVHPAHQAHLPADLRLTILDEDGNTFLEAQSRGADNYLQLQFSGLPGERFGVQVAIADARVVEQFVI
jgi:Protein of unknown function (DUF1822)